MESMKLGRGLPPHVVREILCRVVISNLPNLRVLSKTWNHFVLDYANSSHPFFFTNANAFLLSTCDIDPNSKHLSNPKMHCLRFDTTKHLDLDLDVDFDLESELTKSPSLIFDGDWSLISMANNSCNGLVFICKCARYTRYDGIFNPMTNEFFQVPRCELDDDIHYFGLGFSPTTKQYKLFRVSDSLPVDGNADSDSSIMDVLTFNRSETNHNHNQWRQLHSLPPHIYNHGAYLNGVIYWVGRTEDKPNEYIIHVLNVETEQIELSIVLDVGPCSTSHPSLKQFNGSVYATFSINAKTCNSTIQVWRMQEKDLWIREFVIGDLPINWGSVNLIKAFEDGEILCTVNRDFFCWYNSFTGRKKIVTKNQNKIRSVCQIEYLNFGLLQNILAGEETQTLEETKDHQTEDQTREESED